MTAATSTGEPAVAGGAACGDEGVDWGLGVPVGAADAGEAE